MTASRARLLVATSLSIAVGLTASACSPGLVGQSLRPEEPKGWDVIEPGAGQCRQVSSFGEPLIVDWEAHQRANVEEAMHDGVAVVAYDCKKLRLLKGCHIDGTYGFMSVSKKEQTVRFENADEVAANLPGFGISLLRDLHSELRRDTTLDLAMVMIGKKRTTVASAGRERLVGGEACEGATHFVRAAFVGAFAMGTGTRGEASAGVGLFSGRSASSKLSKYRDGAPDTCTQVSSTSQAAPDSCGALLRLELTSLGTKPADATSAIEPGTCDAGLVLTEGKCARPSATSTHLCGKDDLKDCTEQCGKGHPGSCAHLGLIYGAGRLVPKDSTREVALFKQACDGGALRGCSALGVMFDKGEGVPRDEARAVTLYKQACDGGLALGCNNLGAMYSSGGGVAKDEARAAQLYRRSCDGGEDVGCSNLGELYALGAGVAKDDVRAFALYKQACDAGGLDGCHFLARAYAEGQGVAKDEPRAAAVYKQLCEAGNLYQCVLLARMHAAGRGVTKDEARALELHTRACEGGFLEGCTSVGTCYSRGIGVTKDEARAVEFFKRACKNGDGDATSCANLGTMYERGQGVGRSETRAAELYKLACDKTRPMKNVVLVTCAYAGDMYVRGAGVPVDKGRGLELLRVACSSGASWGCERLDELHEKR
jgi:uncharacterized protein